MKVIAMGYLADNNGKNYRPGDEIKSGTLYDQAEYYESVNQVRIERDSVEPDQLVESSNKWESVLIRNPEPDQVIESADPDQQRYLDTDDDQYVTVPEQQTTGRKTKTTK